MLINIFDNAYGAINYKYNILKKLKLYSIANRVLIYIANLVLPIYLSANLKNYSLDSDGDSGVIVALTTFSSRINNVWIVVELMLRQTFKPDKIILCLSEAEFPNVSSLPVTLQQQIGRGLEIRFSPVDLKVHLKYYLAMQEFLAKSIVIVDDDVFYRTDLLENLVRTNRDHPDCVCCNLGTEVRVGPEGVMAYKLWKECEFTNQPSSKIMPLGVGGVLYPPRALLQNTFCQSDFMTTAPKADDIWLHSMIRLSGRLVVKTSLYSRFLPISGDSKKETLHTYNNIAGGNDIQLKKLQILLKKKYNFDYLNDD